MSNKKDPFTNIKNACDKALSVKYLAGIPDAIQARYDEELDYLKNSNTVNDFEVTRLLCEEARKSAQLIQPRSLLSGSFLYYLISNSKVNPLRPHYYCSECGYYEESNSNLFGIDLPTKKCPNCGEPIIANGVNLPAIHVWNNNKTLPFSFEFNISSGFLPFARRTLEKAYPKNMIVDYGTTTFSEEEGNQIIQGGFAILPEKKTIDDFPDLISYLDDGTNCIMGSIMEFEECFIKKIPLIPINSLNCAVYMQNKTGIYFDEIYSGDLKDITYRDICNTRMINSTYDNLLKTDKPKTFKKMCNFFSASNNTYDLPESAGSSQLETLLQSGEFNAYPLYDREDMYDQLISLGIESNTAYAYSEIVREGTLCSYSQHPTNYSQKKVERFMKLELPDELYHNACKCKYLFPRAHSAAYLFTYAVLAYYMKKDSKTFSTFLKTYHG